MESPERKKKGCLFWGCGGFLVLAVLFLGGAGYLLYMLRDLTSDAPVPIPVKEVKAGEYESVRKEIGGFEKAVEEDRPAKLELSADDLNTMIAKDPGLKELSGSAFVTIEDGQVALDLSLPLDRFKVKVPGIEGRYLNGRFIVEMSMEDGKVSIVPVSAVVKEKPLPGWVLREIQKNVLDRMVGDPKFLEAAKKAKSLKVEGDKVIVER